MKNEKAVARVGPQCHKKNYVVGQKPVRERGINGVSGSDLLELDKDGLHLLYF